MSLSTTILKIRWVDEKRDPEVTCTHHSVSSLSGGGMADGPEGEHRGEGSLPCQLYEAIVSGPTRRDRCGCHHQCAAPVSLGGRRTVIKERQSVMKPFLTRV